MNTKGVCLQVEEWDVRATCSACWMEMQKKRRGQEGVACTTAKDYAMLYALWSNAGRTKKLDIPCLARILVYTTKHALFIGKGVKQK